MERNLPKYIYHKTNPEAYDIRFYKNHSTFFICSAKTKEKIMEQYEIVMEDLEKYGKDYVIENRQKYQSHQKGIDHPIPYIVKQLSRNGILFTIQFNCLSVNGKPSTKRFAYAKDYNRIQEIFQAINSSIEENGFDWTYENRSKFQNLPRHEKDMMNIFERKNKDNSISYYYRRDDSLGRIVFYYGNKDLEKVKEVRDYYLKYGKEATIKEFRLDY